MGIGYGRAARLVDFMAEDGYVGEYNGSKAREVMLSEEQWQNIQNGDANPVNDEDWPEEDELVAVAPAIQPKPAKKQPKLPSKPKAKTSRTADSTTTPTKKSPTFKLPAIDEVLEKSKEALNDASDKIEVAHSKSTSRVRRPKLKNLTKNLGLNSHTAANFVAPPTDDAKVERRSG